MAREQRVKLLVTDLDNTLWDWFGAWYESFSVLLRELAALSGVPVATLEKEIRQIHRQRVTTEYSNLVNEVPSLVEAAGQRPPVEYYNEALHAQNRARLAATALYPDVERVLSTLKKRGIRIAAYTESVAYWTMWRIKQTGLDGIIDTLYSAPDHDLPDGMTAGQLRTGLYDDDYYKLANTTHRYVPRHLTKPNVEILQSIIGAEGCSAVETVYLGDSLIKDIAMADEAGVFSVHAAYGVAQHREGYDLLRRVSHWTDQDISRERELAERGTDAQPSAICRLGIDELLEVLEKKEDVATMPGVGS